MRELTQQMETFETIEVLSRIKIGHPFAKRSCQRSSEHFSNIGGANYDEAECYKELLI